MSGPLRLAAEILAASNHAVALTGAGVSTASGIPDFRGPRGLWRLVDPEVFSIGYFYSDPLTVWRQYMQLYRFLRNAKPNPAHYALAGLESMGVLKAVITQNIDGLHQRAGSRRVIELHGNGYSARCTVCGAVYPIEEVAGDDLERPPTCRRCGGLLKPDVIFFGEPLPHRALEEAMRLAWQSDVILVAGSSLSVSPANQLPAIVKSNGGKVIIVNRGDTMLDGAADLKIDMPVEYALPRLCGLVAESLNVETPLACRSDI